MKNLICILFSVAFIFSSCSDDQLDSERIVGNWNMLSLQISDCDDATDNLSRTEIDGNNCIEVESSGDSICDLVLTVRNDGTAVINFLDDGDADSDDLTYTVNDETGDISFCFDSDCFSAEFREDNLFWIDEFNFNNGCIAQFEFTK